MITLVEMLLALLKSNLTPVIPAEGSVGASGDRAPLGQLALGVIGQGRARVDGQTLPGLAALASAGLEPLTLGPEKGSRCSTGHKCLRPSGKHVPTLLVDREISPDILAAEELIRDGSLRSTVEAARLPGVSRVAPGGAR